MPFSSQFRTIQHRDKLPYIDLDQAQIVLYKRSYAVSFRCTQPSGCELVGGLIVSSDQPPKPLTRPAYGRH